MGVARVVGLRSKCSQWQVGCVVVGQDNRVAGTGYNGAPSRFVDHEICDEVCNIGPCPYVHAETNALLYSDRAARENSTVYVTRLPCLPCAKAIANSGAQRVVLPRLSSQDEGRLPEIAMYLRRASVSLWIDGKEYCAQR